MIIESETSNEFNIDVENTESTNMIVVSSWNQEMGKR